MRTIMIDGQEWGFKARMGAVRKLNAQFEGEIASLMKGNQGDVDPLKIEDFALHMVWEFIVPGKEGRPFKNFETFKDEIDYSDFNAASKIGFYLLWGLDPDMPLPLSEGKDSGNEETSFVS